MKKQISFNPYSQEMLPGGFKYPKSYLNLSKDTSTINWDSEFMFPWWFEDCQEELTEVMNIHQELAKLNNLIPFARNGDWAACFNANDISGSPQVIVVDLGNPKYVSYCDNFDKWLEMAEQNGWT
ncbi:SMI1/KNR4 family protein [Moraxella sp. FZLJ2107]|uniref:SMI1/KNR4 family protein n=1 Tax=unclassified Moraxella TaxID=2685852 RepID=UPI0020C8AA5E|nr:MULTISPECIES: SMI1/KNR4 family protein [unclassified Moraxella]UTO04527.1 SMI1/KNR4 family protein [Moraxella sp. FZLJ2107]UTO23360.1 SMI1/KNR4 family protein [Moraxella sp. FZLJ2109]